MMAKTKFRNVEDAIASMEEIIDAFLPAVSINAHDECIDGIEYLAKEIGKLRGELESIKNHPSYDFREKRPYPTGG